MLSMFGRCRGCGGMNVRSIRFKEVWVLLESRVPTTTTNSTIVIRSRLSTCMELRMLLGTRMDSPGYGVGLYGARQCGIAMKREEKEMRSFSVREEDEEAEGVIERGEVGWDGDGG